MHSLLLFLSILLSLFSNIVSSNVIPFQSNMSILDYGRIIEENPSAILNPNSLQDISQLIWSIFSKNVKYIQVAQRRAAHSTYGQSQALGGIIINMNLLPTFIKVEKKFVDVGVNVLRVEVLRETLKSGLTPRSWTDYLYLTIGGTLSLGGISGQTFKYGPQISNVLELDHNYHRCVVWPSSLFLSEFILSYPKLFSDKVCFEVGSGVGLVGVVLAHAGASKVILTDGDRSSLENMQYNLELNHLTYEKVHGQYFPWELATESELSKYGHDCVL